MNRILRAIESGKILLFAHRGDKDCLPENTMPAFRHAIELGADGIETDIRQTRDGALVMMHDAKVDRTTDGRGQVSELTLAEIRRLDAGVPTRFGGEYAGTRVPTLAEFFELVKPYPDLLLNLELKDYPDEKGEAFARATADMTVAMVEEAGLADRVMFNCFSWEILRYLHERYGDRYPLHGYFPDFLMRSPRENVYPYLTYVCLFPAVKRPDGTVDWAPCGLPNLRPAEDFRTVKEVLGCEPCVCFARDTAYLLKNAVERGATMITSNDPERALGILRALGCRA